MSLFFPDYDHFLSMKVHIIESMYKAMQPGQNEVYSIYRQVFFFKYEEKKEGDDQSLNSKKDNSMINKKNRRHAVKAVHREPKTSEHPVN